MRKLICVLIVMLLTNISFGAVFSESFEYADDAALQAEWFPMDPPWTGAATLNTAVATDGAKSAEVPGVGSMRHELGAIEMLSGGGSISFDWYIDTASLIRPYNFQMEPVVGGGYSGSVYAPGFQSGNYALDFYPGDATSNPLGLTLVEGWNNVVITVDGAGVMGFEANGSTSAYTNAGTWSGVGVITVFDWMLNDTGSSVYDNIVIVPEPMTICLLGFGGLLLRRRKR